VLSEQGIIAKLVGDDDTKPEPAAATTNDNDASSATGCGWSARNPSEPTPATTSRRGRFTERNNC
jgi:hypothetical protein